MLSSRTSISPQLQEPESLGGATGDGGHNDSSLKHVEDKVQYTKVTDQSQAKSAAKPRWDVELSLKWGGNVIFE